MVKKTLTVFTLLTFAFSEMVPAITQPKPNQKTSDARPERSKR
jgi:hypothetical protein